MQFISIYFLFDFGGSSNSKIFTFILSKRNLLWPMISKIYLSSNPAVYHYNKLTIFHFEFILFWLKHREYIRFMMTVSNELFTFLILFASALCNHLSFSANYVQMHPKRLINFSTVRLNYLMRHAKYKYSK